MPTYNEELRDAMIRHQVYLLRHSTSIRNRITEILYATESEIKSLILSRLDGNEGLTSSVEVKRMERLIRSIESIRQGAWDSANKELFSAMQDLAASEPKFMLKIMESTFPLELEMAIPTTAQMRAIALENPFHGAVLSEWADNMSSSDLRRIRSAVQTGMTSGESASSIARRVVGSSGLKGTDGVTQMTRNQVHAVVRTAVSHISNASRQEFALMNSDVFGKEMFLATLDSRTTLICAVNDGKEFDVGKGPRPPLHFQCRSTRIPIVDRDLLGDRGFDPTTERSLVKEFAKENKLDASSYDDLPRGKKGAFNDWARARRRELIGQVPAQTSFKDWFNKQSAEFKSEYLGPTRYELYKKNKLTIDKFVDVNGKPLTISQLLEKYGG